MSHGYKDEASLLDNSEDVENDPHHNKGGPMVDVELAEVTNLQANVSELHSNLWSAYEMTDEEAEELEHQENLLKIKMAQTSEKVKEWGMQTGLERLLHAELRTAKWHEDPKKPVNEIKVFFQTLPVAILFMACVIGASYTHFDDSTPIAGNLYSLAQYHPIVFPMGSSSSMVEARVQIMSSTSGSIAMGEDDGAHHRRSRHNRRSKTAWTTPSVYPRSPLRADSHGAAAEESAEDGAASDGVALSNSTVAVEDPAKSVSFWVFLMQPGDDRWKQSNMSFAGFKALAVKEEGVPNPRLIASHEMRTEELALLLEFEINESPDDEIFVVVSDSEEPLAVAIALHSLGWLGPMQVVIAGIIMSIVFGLIMTEMSIVFGLNLTEV
ncbi:hypothetical protein T484DRAFT_1835214 [Baffinella frigidus]|nr:hypothetical protein T484DRAFT_1835214 [Cryptophyta sp. CCMP2293]